MDEELAQFKTDNVMVPLEKLKLDPENVRFVHLERKLSDKEMEKIIWEEKDTGKLHDSILDAKVLYESPVITSNNVVIEGNRRVVCLRHLQKDAKAGLLSGIEKNHFDTIACKQIPSDTPPLDVDLFVASIHIKGKKKWPPYNRAKQLAVLNESLSYDHLAKRLGMGKVTIIRMVNIYEQMLKYHKRYESDEDWHDKFSYFDELYKKRGLDEFRARQSNVDKFADWVHEKKFDDLRDIRLLDRIVKDEDALRAFEIRGLKAALKLLEEKDPTIKSIEYRQISKTISLLADFPRKELIHTMREPAKRKMLERLKEEIDSLLQDVKSLERKDD